MNIAATVFTVYYALNLLQKKVTISRWSRFLLYLGILLPVGDYLLRFILGEIWFQNEGLIFHSLTYQALFWFVAALLNWVYGRDIKKSRKLLLPLVGLLLYAGFSIFSMENLSFLAPFSSVSFGLGWVSPGFVFSTVVFAAIWVALLGSDLSETILSILALFTLIIFIAYSGFSYHRINRDLTTMIPDAGVVSITPVNHQQTMWQVTKRHRGKYYHTEFHFIQGQQGEVAEHPALADFDVSQMALLDPIIRGIYWKAFRNPVIQVDIQNESMQITVSELLPLIEPIWVKRIQLRKNKSGQTVLFEIDYGTLF